MPYPKKGESKDDYLERCMSDSEMNKKFSDNKQRYAVCNSYWKEKSKAKVSISEDGKTLIAELPEELSKQEDEQDD